MRLTDGDIKDFQRLWREEFQEEVPADIARERASRLIDLYLLFLKEKRKTE